ncbi:metalloprotease family protein [Gracilibacillus lacisalsi]|uniref:metalloprotease family protein n=1 Tax=Gracilibacillus lacisalsi TaxID=393087 RepID=UPI00036B1BA6|nr:metalloprotease family protein [Gracilibacillus lacisalsi]
MTLLTFLIQLMLATLLVLIVHEVGHIIPIMLFNILEGKPFYYFGIEINFKYFYVTHEKFDHNIRNLIVAISGCLFPIFVAILMFNIIDTAFTSLFILLAFGNLIMLHPNLPDGKNIINILTEMRDNSGKNI